jgi:hypothetical protein
MTINGPSPKTTLHKTWIAMRFVIFGIGGFWLLMFCWVALVERLHPGGERLMNPYWACPLGLVGAFMMLFGAGEWGRWAYLWVFLSTPLVVSVVLLIPLPDWGGRAYWVVEKMGILVFVLPLVVSYAIVRRYYRHRDLRPVDVTHP